MVMPRMPEPGGAILATDSVIELHSIGKIVGVFGHGKYEGAVSTAQRISKMYPGVVRVITGEQLQRERMGGRAEFVSFKEGARL